MNNLKEYRCHINNHLLCKAGGEGQVEIMNPSNRFICYTGPSRVDQNVGPKGEEFLRNSIEMRCTQCGKMLGRGLGLTLVCEIKCHRCKNVNTFDFAEIHEHMFRHLPILRRSMLEDIIRKQIGLK